MQTATIRPLSWRLASELTTLTPSFFALRLPEKWKLALLRLESLRSGRDAFTIPCDGLHRALTALVGDLLVIEPRAWFGKNAAEFWLISDREVALEAIHLIVVTWAELVWGKVAGCATTLANLKAEDLQWQTIAPNLADWGKHDNGTANPKTPSAFSLLPHYIAGALSQPDVQLQIGSQSRDLRRCPTARGAELMTWQPETLQRGKTVYPFCLTLHFSVQTVPFQSFPIVNCEVGVRRWKAPKARIQRGNTSVYLCSRVPWLPNLHHTDSFQVAPLRWHQNEAGKPEESWSRKTYLVELLNRLHPQSKFPAASDVLNNSDVYTTPDALPFAGVVHNTRMGPHPVGSGVFPRDLREIWEQLEILLAPLSLVSTRQPRKIQIPNGFKAAENLFAQAVENSADEKENATEIQENRGVNLPIESGGEVHLEFFYQSSRVRQVFEYNLRRFFGIAPGQSFPFTLQSGGLLHFRTHNLGAIGAPLDARENRAAYLKRCGEITEYLAAISTDKPLHPTLSFIEIEDADYFKNGGGGDPKNALRAGFAACGRLTQFLVAPPHPEQDLPANQHWNNAEGALLDGIRQLGLPAQLPSLERADLPTDMNIMGLWIFKNCADSAGKPAGTLPAWLRLNTLSGRIEVKARGFAQWMPYRQAQLALANPHSSSVDFIAPGLNDFQVAAQVTNFVQEVLRFEVSGDTLICCDAQNSRKAWKWLQDGRIMPDALGFLDNAPHESLASSPNWSGLRLLRVRDHAAGEVPQHFALRSDDATWTRGVFAFDDDTKTRVFGSVVPKPVQWSGLSKAMSRWDQAKSKDAHNPRLLELTLAVLQPHDDPESWAALAHHLRDASAHYRSETALPFPLHLAMKIGEYVLPV